MSRSRTAYNTALRLIRQAPARNAVIVATIAVPTGVAVAAWTASWSTAPALVACAVAAAMAMLVVAQASPDPTGQASARAWRAVGAAPRSAGRPQRIATRLVGWAGVALGVAGGMLLGGRLDHPQYMQSRSVLPVNMARPAIALVFGLALVSLGSVAVVGRRQHLDRPVRRLWRGVGLVLVAVAAALDVAIAGSLRTDFDASLGVPMATLLTVIVGVTALGLVTTGLARVAEQFASWRPAAHLAARHLSSRFVRTVVVSAMVVAVAGFTLGASVAARSHRVTKATDELQRLPVVPPDVMVLERCCRGPLGLGNPGQAPGDSSGFSLANIAEVARHFPGSQIIPVAEVSGPQSGLRFYCPATARLQLVLPLTTFSCSEPVVLADPRLDLLFDRRPGRSATTLMMTPADASQRQTGICSDQTACQSLSGRQSVASPSDAVRARLAGAPLPKATWSEQRFFEIDRSSLTGTRFRSVVRTLIITRSTPYGAADRRSMGALAVDPRLAGHSGAAWTSTQRSESFGNTVPRTVPWAPVTSSTQWSIATVASLLALLVVLGMGAVDALDRRQDNRRLELLGATPGQIRAGAALYAGLELGTAAVLAIAAVCGLVAYGTHRYSTAVPDFPLTFVLPARQLAVLVAAVPAIGAIIAAGVARPPFALGRLHTAAAPRGG